MTQSAHFADFSVLHSTVVPSHGNNRPGTTANDRLERKLDGQIEVRVLEKVGTRRKSSSDQQFSHWSVLASVRLS